MEIRPKEKGFAVPSFAAHSARGLIRDARTRRWIMFILLLVALVMVAAGSTFLAGFLNPREHAGWFIAFWLVCAWLTCTALLLALFDLLIVRAQARVARRILREAAAQQDRLREES